jgi:uncharacterized membrane protein
MEGFIILIVLAVGCVLCGPIALIISIIALNKSKVIYHEPPERVERIKKEEIAKPTAAPEKLAEVRKKERPAEVVGARRVEEEKKSERELLKAAAERIKEKERFTTARKAGTLELQIGTRWVLIAGVITVIFAVGFFLKYAYDSGWIGPTGRVIIAAVSGLVALAVGEVTRRRGYGIVAKGVTALGFAILYLAVFAAYGYYHLFASPTPAFVLAVLVTVAAMLYAVSLNEIVVAFLSLLGGFLTPVLVSTGENHPIALFCYVLILGVGAMLCAFYRKWRAVDLLAFVGTFALYIGWFEKFFRHTMRSTDCPPKQIAIALGWLGVFFVIYLILPMLYELVKKVKAREEDVLLVLVNAAVVFYYLWTILFDKYRTPLAFCALVLCAAHLVMMSVVIRRCKEDLNLRLALLAIGLFFLTIAVPLYLKMYAVAMAWAVEGVILAVIGLRYRSVWTQVGAAVALLLSFGQLLHRLPMHIGAFDLVFNHAFGTWCFVAGALVVCHIIYRRTSLLAEDQRGPIAQVLYTAATLLLMAAVAMEWYWHCRYNMAAGTVGNRLFLKGMVIILTAFPLVLLVRPICPRGMVCRILAMILAGAGAIFTMVAFSEFYSSSFVIFANVDFGIVLVFIAALFAAGWLLSKEREEDQYNRTFAIAFALAGIFVLWVLLTEEIYLYWYCQNRFGEEKIYDWRFLSHMYISVMWAVYGAVLMTVGFCRKSKILRYIALSLFALLLVKVFIWDTIEVKKVYRIAAFLATGLALVGISYLYQFLRKRGYFDTMLAEKSENQ